VRENKNNNNNRPLWLIVKTKTTINNQHVQHGHHAQQKNKNNNKTIWHRNNRMTAEQNSHPYWAINKRKSKATSSQ